MLGLKEARLKFLISAQIDQIKEAKNFLILLFFVVSRRISSGRLREALAMSMLHRFLVKRISRSWKKAKLSKLDKLTSCTWRTCMQNAPSMKKSAVVGSMNLHEGSERNREMAIVHSARPQSIPRNCGRGKFNNSRRRALCPEGASRNVYYALLRGVPPPRAPSLSHRSARSAVSVTPNGLSSLTLHIS